MNTTHVIRCLTTLSLLAGAATGCSSSDAPGASAPVVPDGGHCVLDTCAAASANCGKVEDGCNGVLECGSCTTAGQTCGAGGPNICGVGTCTKTTCAAEGKDCGQVADGCGDLLDCGKCTAPKTCGGGSLPDPNVCG
jgi:hypothetical protein